MFEGEREVKRGLWPLCDELQRQDLHMENIYQLLFEMERIKDERRLILSV